MQFLKLSALLILVFILSAAYLSCSHGKSPVEPGMDTTMLPESDSIANRSIVAVYDVTIDPEAKTVEMTQSERSTAFHFPVSNLFPNVLQITGYSWTPNFWVEIKMQHPYPGSTICGFDPRVIAILPANNGVNFNYPTINAKSNNAVVLLPDGYTKLFDSVGGSIAGTANPFKAYFQGQPYHAWYGRGLTNETQRWDLNLAGFGGAMTYKLVVDVSTNYPAAPQPIVDNCQEPYKIDAQISDGMTEEGGSATLDVVISDWQGKTGIGGVVVEAPDIFNGIVNLSYIGPGPSDHQFTYQKIINNTKLAPAGGYKLLIAAWDSTTQVAMLNEFKYTVSPVGPYNPVDVTPERLNTSPIDLCVKGNKLYTVGNTAQGIHVFDLSDPTEPNWEDSIRIGVDGLGIDVEGEYAYVAAGYYGLHIIHFDPSGIPHYVKLVDTPGEAYNVDCYGDYAYVADYDGGLAVVDISSPENASVVKSVSLPEYGMDVFVANSTYAYVATSYYGISVINISDPVNAYMVTYLDGENSVSVYVEGNYAYLADAYGGFTIVDISNPAAPSLVKYLEMDDYTVDAFVLDGYAYVLGESEAIYVVDVDPPASAHVVSSYVTQGNTRHLAYKSGYLYVSDYGNGMLIFDITTPGTLVPATSLPTALNVQTAPQIKGNFAYVVGQRDSCFGMQKIMVSPLSSAHTENIIKTVGFPMSIDIDGDYAYVADLTKGLSVYNIADPYNITLAKNVQTTIETQQISVADGFALLANRDTGIAIIDVDPLVSAHVDKTFDPDTWDYTNDIQASNGYLYLAMYSQGLFVVDVNPPESSSVIKKVDLPGNKYGITLGGDYAFLSSETILTAININPPESAYKVKEVNSVGADLQGLCYSDGFVYVADQGNPGKLVILDVELIDSASVISSIEIPGQAWDVTVVDNYAYVAAGDAGIRIIKLW